MLVVLLIPNSIADFVAAISATMKRFEMNPQT
jgi:hypothetical protein